MHIVSSYPSVDMFVRWFLLMPYLHYGNLFSIDGICEIDIERVELDQKSGEKRKVQKFVNMILFTKIMAM